MPSPAVRFPFPTAGLKLSLSSPSPVSFLPPSLVPSHPHFPPRFREGSAWRQTAFLLPHFLYSSQTRAPLEKCKQRIGAKALLTLPPSLSILGSHRDRKLEIGKCACGWEKEEGEWVNSASKIGEVDISFWGLYSSPPTPGDEEGEWVNFASKIGISFWGLQPTRRQKPP